MRQATSDKRQVATCLLLVTCILLLGIGCADRQLTIRSDPPGAKVIVDGEDKGVTPATIPFTYYGGREVILEKDGYQTLKTIVPVKPPFIHIFPFDIVMLFVPYPIIDHHEAYFILSKYKKPDVKKSLEQAEILKEHLQKTLQK